MGKTAGRHRPPAPGSQHSKEYQSLLDQRERLAQEVRSNHELLQEIKQETHRAREASAQLSERLDAWALVAAAQASADDEHFARLEFQTRAVMREVISAELKPFRVAVRDHLTHRLDQLVELQGSVALHMNEILGFTDTSAFVAEVANQVTLLIMADIDEQRKQNGEPTLAHAYVIDFIAKKREKS